MTRKPGKKAKLDRVRYGRLVLGPDRKMCEVKLGKKEDEREPIVPRLVQVCGNHSRGISKIIKDVVKMGTKIWLKINSKLSQGRKTWLEMYHTYGRIGSKIDSKRGPDLN